MTTYANWVSKTANLLTDELGLEAGDTVLIDLPPHWLVPVFLGAAWSAGLSVTDDVRGRRTRSPCVGRTASASTTTREHVVACSLLPFAVRFAEPIPGQVLDFGLLWPGQSDVFVALTPPSPDTVAWVSAERAADPGRPAGGGCLHRAHGRASGCSLTCTPRPRPASRSSWHRWCTEARWCCSGIPAEATWPARREDERATVELRAGDQPPSL